MAVIPSGIKEIMDVNRLCLSLKLLFSGTFQNALLVNKITLFINLNYSKTFVAAVKSKIPSEKTNLRNALGHINIAKHTVVRTFP